MSCLEHRLAIWEAVVESRSDIAQAERITTGEAFEAMHLTKAQCETIGRKHLDVAVKRVRMRDGEEQGDISDLLFAPLDEYFLDLPEFRDGS
jgi:hypothetical protein